MMTTGLRWYKATKMAGNMEQRSFESALASTLERLDLGFSLRVEQKKKVICFEDILKDIFSVIQSRKVGPSPIILPFQNHTLLTRLRCSK